METLVKLNTQTAGRDKIARLIQYISRFIWYKLQRSRGQEADKIRSLEYTLSTFRKLLRLGRCVDVLYAVFPTIHHPDPFIRYSVGFSKVNNALFLLADHVLWFGRSGLCNVDLEKWGLVSNKYWLYSITLNLVRDFYEIISILKSEKNAICPVGGFRTLNDLLMACFKAYISVHARKDVMVDTIKNTCDFFIPFTALGYTKLSPSTIGFLGTISSLAGMLALIDPKYKLIPM